MVVPDEVVEFSCLDVFGENSKGTISKMCLTIKIKRILLWKATSSKRIAPVFVKFRTDKKATSEDAGLLQINKIFPLAKSADKQSTL